MAIEYNFTLDMDRSKRDNNIAYARTGDVDSITINADLVFNGAAYTPTGTNAFFECITPNGCSIRAAAEKTGSTVSVEVPSAAFQAAGVINVAYFRFESGEADNPTYVESTEPFAIVVREGIGDNIDAGDYIEEWRKLADRLEAVVAEVEQKADQAETAINEQKTEVDQLKAQAQVSIAGDVTEVEEAAQSAIAAINKEKADVADAAEDVSAAGEQAINTFKTNSQQAINQFNTDGTSAINQFNTKADGKLEEVDGMITEAQGDVDAAITQLENETQNAIDAAHDALDGTTATKLQNAINRTLKLDVADMTDIPSNSSLSSFTNVGSYCCKTAATAATVGDCPIDDGPFNMYVFSSSTSGQVMQLVVPVDLNGKPTAEWHVRFGTSSAMDPWSVIGGGADIAAGLGIDVTGDAQKTVSLDTTAFYQHHEAAEIIKGSTEVTGGGRVKELTVYGNTKQNLWVNPSGTNNGVTVTSNEDGTVSVSGVSTAETVIHDPKDRIYLLKPSTTYTASIDREMVSTARFGVREYNASANALGTVHEITTSGVTFTTDEDMAYVVFRFSIGAGKDASGTYRVMLNEGDTAEPWCKPGISSVTEASFVTAGKNIAANFASRLPITTNGITFSDNGDGGIRVSGTNDTETYLNLLDGSTPICPPQGQEITISGSVNGINIISGFRYEVGTGQSIPNTSIVSSNGKAATGTVPLAAKAITLYIQAHAGTHDDIVYPQLELGSSATEYEPPSVLETPIDLKGNELCAVGDYRDVIYLQTGALTKNTARFDNGDAWGNFTKSDSTRKGYINVVAGNFNATFMDILSNIRVSKSTFADDTASDPSFAFNGIYLFFRFSLDDASNLKSAVEYMKRIGAFCIIPANGQTVQLDPIDMPDLASPDYIIYASSNIPVEIEADVVKVDYLPASDVYTKEEVDKKIEDVGGMPDIVPVSQGGTGVTTAAAERNRLGLGNTTGALPVANGGTGAANAKAAQYNLLNDAIQRSTNEDVNDETNFALFTVSANTTNGAVQKLPALNIWNYILGKIRSVFGFDSSNVLPVANGGTGLTKAPSMLVNLESASAANPLASDPRPGVSGELPLTRGGTGGTSAAAARTNLGVYSKVEVDGKVPKVVYGTGNIPSNAENGTIYIQYRS